MTQSDFTGCSILVVLAAIAGGFVGGLASEQRMEREAVAAGVGTYAVENGITKFQWNTEKPATPSP